MEASNTQNVTDINREEFIEIINRHIDGSLETACLEFTKTELAKYKYNKKVRESVKNDSGVYFISVDAKVVYIGMAGKYNNNENRTSQSAIHGLERRLCASRGKTTVTTVEGKRLNRDIQSWEYFSKILKNHNKSKLQIDVFYTSTKYLAGYVEALMIQKFFEISKGKLPLYNKSF